MVFSRHRLRLVGRTDGGLHPAFYSSPNGDIVEHRICEITRDSGYPPPATSQILRPLEDAAEALGSEYKGRKCGTFGEFACLSFNGNKMITTSGGGALVCSTKEEANRTKFLATQARDNAPHYQHSHVGYNYRLSNICAGIGRGQMMVLDDHVERRRRFTRFIGTS